MVEVEAGDSSSLLVGGVSVRLSYMMIHTEKPTKYPPKPDQSHQKTAKQPDPYKPDEFHNPT